MLIRTYLSIGMIVMPSIAYSMPFLCVAEKVTGFDYNRIRGDWDSKNFTANQKYIIRERKEKDTNTYDGNYLFFEIGDENPRLGCSFEIEGVLLECSGVFSKLYFSIKSGKYVRNFIGGYLIPDEILESGEDRPETPYIEIGQCSTL